MIVELPPPPHGIELEVRPVVERPAGYRDLAAVPPEPRIELVVSQRSTRDVGLLLVTLLLAPIPFLCLTSTPLLLILLGGASLIFAYRTLGRLVNYTCIVASDELVVAERPFPWRRAQRIPLRSIQSFSVQDRGSSYAVVATVGPTQVSLLERLPDFERAQYLDGALTRWLRAARA